MSKDEMVFCPTCKEYFYAPTQEIASYICPHCAARTRIHQQHKILDEALLKRKLYELQLTYKRKKDEH
jgi:acetyl-CoA carboxylase beta subunit